VSRSANKPILALTQGDPAGVGPEIVMRAALGAVVEAWLPVLLVERAALEAVRSTSAEVGRGWERLRFLPALPDEEELSRLPPDAVLVVDPVSVPRPVTLGASGPADAAGAIAALDLGIELARGRKVAALITAPVSKESIARHERPGFRGHTDYLAQACGLKAYGRDYLMAFLSEDLKVALLSTHVPLASALVALSTVAVVEAVECLAKHTRGTIAVAALNPHAGEGGLFGDEDDLLLRPAVETLRERGIQAFGPESADSLFARARRGEFDWVLALYHDQGLIAVKTASFGSATNWTIGLPFVRTSVDHGTAFSLAGTDRVDAEPMRRVVATTLDLISG
jgi:4-hydroxythreonine-4-phosphate dehydrogenase